MPNGTYERIKQIYDTLPLRSNVDHVHVHWTLSSMSLLTMSTISTMYISNVFLCLSQRSNSLGRLWCCCHGWRHDMEFIPLCCIRETLAKGTRDRWKMTMKSRPENHVSYRILVLTGVKYLLRFLPSSRFWPLQCNFPVE